MTLVGKTLSHYRIAEKIGAGGMGEVYRARDTRLERDVAVKVLPPHALEDEAARRRFRKEALALSKLNHPHVCTIFDFDSQEGMDFLVMEYVKGETLAHRLQGGPLAEDEAIRLGRQIGDALGAAHHQGVIHRDLKPGNIMVTPTGDVKVMDFGLAKEWRAAGAESATLTATAEVVGTLPYMAPEQLMGETTDARTDIHALGVVLYEMATGRLPFEGGSSVALADAILHHEPPPLRQGKRPVSRGLEAVILRCLEKDPSRRYPSGREFTVALGQAGAGAGLSEIARRIWRRHWVPLAAGALVLTLAVALVRTGALERWMGGGTQTIDALAVLPLANLSGDPAQQYFADGMTEEVIVALSKIPSLRVISRQSVMGFRNSKDPVRKIASALRVDALVTGSVRRIGDRVRITSELIQADPERHLWADSYEGNAGDVPALQARLASDIGKRIGAKLTPEQRERVAASRTVDPAAHDEYLKGLSIFDRFDLIHYQDAFQHFKKAVTIDPLYAQGWSGLARAYYALSSLYLPPDEMMPKSRAAALRALSIDSTLADARVNLAVVYTNYDCNWDLAERELRRVIDLNPSNAEAEGCYGALLRKFGRAAEAAEHWQRALELNPLSTAIEGGGLAFGEYLAGHYDRSAARYRRILRQEPDNPVWHWSLGFCLEEMGELSEAVAEHRLAVSLAEKEGGGPVHWSARAFLCRSYVLAGLRAEALALLRSLEAEKPASRYALGTIYAALGDSDRAFEWLGRALRARDEELLDIKVDPKLRSLRSDPRFGAMLRELHMV